MDLTIQVENGAEAFVELLNAEDTSYIFLNPGTDTIYVQEALAKFKALNKRAPEVILSLHESVGMAAAHGYFMVSGKPQVVLVHTDLGLQQLGGALHNAQRGRAGVVLCSGRAPANIDENRFISQHWLQEQYDQPGILRGYVKWEYELRSNENIHHVVQRAFQVASTEPYGPVYLCLPQDALSEKIKNVCIPSPDRHSAVSTPQADYSEIAEIASLLVQASNPLIITGYSGRHPDTVAALVELAALVSTRIIGSPTRVNFPTTHPLFCGFNANPYIGTADVILVVDNDIPYIPCRAKPGAGTKVIHVDIDPLKRNMPMWGFPADMLVQADSGKFLAALIQAVKQKVTSEQQVRNQSRLRDIQGEHVRTKSVLREMATRRSTKKPIFPDWVTYCVNEAIDEETIVVCEPVTNMASVTRQVERARPGTMFHSGGSSLGWALGASIGAKLASPDKVVAALVGDGSFIFGCPTAALWMSHAYNAPFLCVIFNNQRYNASRIALRGTLGENSYSQKSRELGRHRHHTISGFRRYCTRLLRLRADG